MYEMGHSRLEVSKGFLGLLSLLQALYKRGLLFRFTDSSSLGYPSTQKSRLLQYTELISYLLSPLSDTDLIDCFRSRILLLRSLIPSLRHRASLVLRSTDNLTLERCLFLLCAQFRSQTC